MASPITLRVFPNPFAAVDHEGRPCGVVLCDPVEHIPYADPKGDRTKKNPAWEMRQYVGARVAKATTRIAPDKKEKTKEIVWEWDEEAVTLPKTDYYLARLRAGALIAADEETAKLAKVPFVARDAALATAKRDRAAEWKAHFPNEKLPADLAPPLALVTNTKKEVA